MEQYSNLDIAELSLSAPFFREKVTRFLESSGLRADAMDAYYCIQNQDSDIIAGAGISHDIIKCVAVAPEARSEGLLTPLVSRIIQDAALRGIHNLKVFTKPEYRALFESLGFKKLAAAPEVILLENGRGLADYVAYLEGMRRTGRSGVVVMNANPFTLGHKYLLSKALEEVDNLYVIPVREDVSMFPYSERKAMIEACGLGDRVIVPDGSSYIISAATFPTYFLKDLSTAAETQMRLDIDLFGKHIAPALGAEVRFVGSEPHDSLTARYNELMKQLLPLKVVETERLSGVSASKVRAALEEGVFEKAAFLTPSETHPYLLASLARRALRVELDTPLKPGLVCPDSNGAHKDMDYGTMLRGIEALRPFFPAMATASSARDLCRLGVEAEKAMLAATGGVNTHRGAIYAIGLALNAAGRAYGRGEREMQVSDTQEFMQKACREIAGSLLANSLTDNDIHFTRGARAMALSGYRLLFEDWLPFYRTSREKDDREVLTLLKIMSTLDDTCIVHRVGEERAKSVREEAKQLLSRFDKGMLVQMCERYAREGISPGGAADMLSLTIFTDSII
ncbi:MAG: triphosphoribosyl-dephospho-CoA synthase [Bacteroidales bacterium]|nr:triphosphoribosyl-dephospho-CoA synthase [Bacteroidales bacterium]